VLRRIFCLLDKELGVKLSSCSLWDSLLVALASVNVIGAEIKSRRQLGYCLTLNAQTRRQFVVGKSPCQWWSPRGHVLSLEDRRGRFLSLAVKSLTLAVLDSITVSDNDDVSTLWQPLYESVGHILRLSLHNFAESLHSLFGFNDVWPWPWPRVLKPLASHTWP